MHRWIGKNAVVTGASSGIGLETAKELVKHGINVFGLARNKTDMENNLQDGAGKFYACKCDVSSEKEVTDTFNWIKQNFGVVQILVNNAGLTVNGALDDTSRNDWEKVFNVNVLGLLECTKQTVTMLKETDLAGHIINVNSIQGHRVYRLGNVKTNVYAASKHAVTAISETLRNDLDSKKIRVTNISPALTRTQILKRSGVNFDMSTVEVLEPEDIAAAIVYVLSTPPRVEITQLTIESAGHRRS